MNLHIEETRLRYKPQEIKYLFIAETPPKSTSNRFFYFENVDKQDSLFMEIMKFLYPEDTENISPQSIRKSKLILLNKFKNDGFYLIDSLEIPFEKKYNQSQKIKLLKQGQNQLLEKIKSIISSETKVILIATPVFKANYTFLKENDIPILNTEPINFPGSGQQKKFKQKMKNLCSCGFVIRKSEA